MITSDKLRLLGLKAKICGYQHISCQLRKRISRLKGNRRHARQLTKRELGTHTRSYLLAYGFLRGIPYRQIERKHGPGNAPDANQILEIVNKDGGLYLWQQKKLTIETIRAWLNGGGDKGVKRPSIKEGDKLYIVTRRDIPAGYQAVQSCHATRQFMADHPEIDDEWFEKSNYMCLLSVENETELMRLLALAHDHGLRSSAFRESDVGDAITAIVLEPHPKSQELCKGLTIDP